MLTSTEALHGAAKAHLEATRLRINSEIQNYPTPIPHCDQQFNWLLDQRDAVTSELYRLEHLAEEADRNALDAFLRTSPFLDGEVMRRQVEQKRRDVLSELEHYPTPIFRTDVQFTGLLEQRQAFSDGLHWLDALITSPEAAVRAPVATVPR